MFTEFHFIRPYWLLALIPCLTLAILLLKHTLQRGNWVNVCDAALLPYILQQKPVKQSKVILISTSIAAILAIFALAGPTWERLPVPVFRNDSGLVIVLDLSRSMLANDIKPNRLSRARYKIADILKQRKDGQTALIVYAGDAFTVTPLTEDNATISGQLNALEPKIMPSVGSNAVLALQKAQELFKQASLQKGHILLISDGVDLDKTLSFVEELSPYKLSVLAVGTEDGAPIKLAQGGFLKDKQGNIVVPKLPLSELKKLASVGGGLGLQISDNDSDIKSLLAAVDSSIQSSGDNPQEDLLLDQWNDKGAWLLLLVLPLVALNFRRGLLGFIFLLLLPLPENSYALEWQDLWQTKDQQAQKAYQQQDYSKAAENFDDPNWKAAAQYKAGQHDKVSETLKDVKTADSFYNQGNALTKAGKLAEAVESYKQALKLKPEDDDTKYNKKLVEKELEKQQQEQQKQDQDKKQQDGENKEKDDKPKDDKNSEQSKEGDSEDKSEQQKPSDSESKESDKQPSEKSESEQQKEQDKEAQQAEKTEQSEEDKKAEEEAKQQQAAAQQKPIDESKQADEQWLQRIPDDPAGLLRRKFEYQYKLRKRKNNDDEQAW